MESVIYYIVKVHLIRFVKNEKIDFINTEIEFIDENPIIAREKAFTRYQSFIETILGENNIPHSLAKEKLSTRI